jgi:hypothetical protein
MLVGLFDNVTEMEYFKEDLGPGAVLLHSFARGFRYRHVAQECTTTLMFRIEGLSIFLCLLYMYIHLYG